MRLAFFGSGRYSRPLDATAEKKFRALSALGEIFVTGFANGWRPRTFTEHARFYLLPDIPFPVLRYIEVFTLFPVLILWLVMRNDVRIVVAQGPYQGCAAAVAKVLVRLLGKKSVLIVECLGDFEAALFLRRRVMFPSLYRLLMHWAARFALSQADSLRCVSDSTRRQLEAWAPEKPIAQFPAWTDLQVFLDTSNMERPTPTDRIVMFAGTLNSLKGVHLLIDAFGSIAAELPDAKLILAGQASSRNYEQRLRESSRRLGIEDRVLFLGFVPQIVLAGHMARARVLALPSFSEGLPRVVYEAMACATPVIGSRIPGITELVLDGETGFLFEPGDVASLADRIRWVLEHPDEAERMGRRSRSIAEVLPSYEAYVSSYRQLFETTMASLQPTRS